MLQKCKETVNPVLIIKNNAVKVINDMFLKSFVISFVKLAYLNRISSEKNSRMKIKLCCQMNLIFFSFFVSKF